MFTPHDPTHPKTTPVQNRRRLRIGSALMTITVAVGVTYILCSSKQPALSVPNLVQLGSKSGGERQLVRPHTKMQAYGPNWSLLRERMINEYTRRVASAA